jgi:hypothetical protein
MTSKGMGQRLIEAPAPALAGRWQLNDLLNQN